MNLIAGIILLFCVSKIESTGIVRTDCTCGEANIRNSGRIVNGISATPNKYPWQAGMYAPGPDGGLMCGGSIISDRNILSAGHCVFYTPNVQEAYWLLGLHDQLKRDGIRYNILHYELHPYFRNYTVYDDYDMTMITLDRQIFFDSKIHPICLTTPRDDYTNQQVIVSGWGRLGDYQGAGTGTLLQETRVRVKRQMECNELTKRLVKYNPQSMICAHEKNTDACNGDSGGPLFLETDPNRYELIGVVSFGDGCARDFPGIYGKLADPTTQRWIKEYILKSQGNVCNDPTGKTNNFFTQM